MPDSNFRIVPIHVVDDINAAVSLGEAIDRARAEPWDDEDDLGARYAVRRPRQGSQAYNTRQQSRYQPGSQQWQQHRQQGGQQGGQQRQQQAQAYQQQPQGYPQAYQQPGGYQQPPQSYQQPQGYPQPQGGYQQPQGGYQQPQAYYPGDGGGAPQPTVIYAPGPQQPQQPVVVYQPAPPPDDQVIILPEMGKWPQGWFDRTGSARAGSRLAVASKPGSGIRPGVIPLENGLYLVGEIPEEALLGGDECGFLPLLIPMMIKAGQKALAKNPVHFQPGEPGQGIDLVDESAAEGMALGAEEDGGGHGRKKFKFRLPRWLQRKDADEWGFGG